MNNAHIHAYIHIYAYIHKGRLPNCLKRRGVYFIGWLESGKTSPWRFAVSPAMAADALDAAGPEVEALGPSLRVHVGVLSGLFGHV